MRSPDAPLDRGAVAALDWKKMDGLLPATVQDRGSRRVLMTGYMNRAALEATIATREVTFWSRSKARLWKKGETSGNILSGADVYCDCDGDALLVLATPAGPVCHEGTASCFAAAPHAGPGWLADLARIIAARGRVAGSESYTARLLAAGPQRIAQKVGEEGVELALAGAAGTAAECVSEAADLLYHVAVLLEARNIGWDDVVHELQIRHAKKSQSK
ncbi:bifunctional phosphoribosyl-AMP cyclohydrolase/phosphoribosyl-ATP diphosphatase HisIE [Allosphingosinicella indica]|uniref:Histidine biosynthesis bifunctional protein HisIE n=1 Tax=Allosphingosinicella indica TaxID=941907 RepID=A0A1X7FZG0_9SPHN|nr:bifunctional phosphoribosyl-AMP cyclohydrolase/phosphoribosyl-ATP diphosphatase HisIE [Allosphingosinicella indica]SMF61093.1 phosphoribosyl-ATP pyrophosphatase /phosphoribosyl-AMP cyclohydrolase [Allosphingosinicella indica]